MAERRPPGFNVDLGFYDSAEVLSIPRKIRAAAIGVWTLCGCYSANKLSDGYVSAEALRDRGCTPAIRMALMKTQPEPLWEDAGDGAIQFTRWSKWQRTATEIKDYRAAEAERKRLYREEKKRQREGLLQPDVDATWRLLHANVDATWSPDGRQMDATSAGHEEPVSVPTGGDSKTSARTSGGRPSESRDPKTETETETEIKIKEPPYPPPDEPSPSASPRRKTGAEIALARFTEIPASGSPAARQAAGAYNRSLPVPLEAKLLNDVTAEIDRCLRSGIPPAAIAAGIDAWTRSDSWSPSQIPKFVHKAANAARPRNGVGKATAKALNYDDAASQLINELEKS